MINREKLFWHARRLVFPTFLGMTSPDAARNPNTSIGSRSTAASRVSENIPWAGSKVSEMNTKQPTEAGQLERVGGKNLQAGWTLAHSSSYLKARIIKPRRFYLVLWGYKLGTSCENGPRSSYGS